LSCDAVVLAAASPAQRIAYGQALLQNALQSNTPHRASAWWMTTSYYGAKHQMKQRLVEMKQHKPLRKPWLLAAVLLVSGAGLGWQQQLMAAGVKADELVPVFRQEPKYPLKAAQDRVEGYVQAKFDIQPDGSVHNITIIKSVPAGVFDQVSLRALEKWRYQPAASGTLGATVQLDFMMDEPSQGMENMNVKADTAK